MRPARLLLGLGGILTVVRLPFPGGLATAVAVLGAAGMVLGALLLPSRVSQPGRSLGTGVVLVAAAAGLEVSALLPMVDGDIVATAVGPVLRAAGVLALAWGAAQALDREGAPLHRVRTWLFTFAVGLMTWLPLAGILGSAAWHIGTGRSDAASFSITGSGSLLVMAAAVAPLLVLMAPATLWGTTRGPELEPAEEVRR